MPRPTIAIPASDVVALDNVTVKPFGCISQSTADPAAISASQIAAPAAKGPHRHRPTRSPNRLP